MAYSIWKAEMVSGLTRVDVTPDKGDPHVIDHPPEACWCGPYVQAVYVMDELRGYVITHNDWLGLKLNLHPRYLAEAKR